MGIQVASSSPSSSLGAGCMSLSRAQSSSSSSLAAWSVGIARRRAGHAMVTRALSASIDSVGSHGGDDEEFLRRIQELAVGLHPGAGGCGWPASVERSASSVGLPLSLRMLKRKKRQQWQRSRWNDRLPDRAGESGRGAVGRAFSSMVLIIRELQSFALQMRQALFYEDMQSVLARVHAEMDASFVWLFQHIFAGTPALMVSVMLLLANFTVYSMGDNIAMAANLPPPQPTVAAVAMLDAQHAEQSRPDQRFDSVSLKLNSFSIGRTASVDGSSGGGGKARPVAGATGDDRSDESCYRQSGAVLPQDESQATPVGAAAEDTEDELVIWRRIAEEATRMQASVRVEALMDPDILGQLVAPVEAKLDTEDLADYARTEQRYAMAVSEEPSNALLLANFAQFLYLVQRDHDRAEHYFKRAVRAEQPADAETLGWYATFLWKARDDLAAAEETFQEAIAAEPSNGHHAAAYAHFLWNTGGEDTCYPLD
ncbi:hypothetical protein D1007_10368 [Hordeum vulgare]|uniref:Uncharacterized protein n=1 Tax=Hordeum vulgare subsp. vulgare TaxID=112509 RepID=A0A8I6XHA1_HORVV|nr:uncharacterized protein LOC123444864 [Hordeum vulgare subsp. vulgare]KAE8812665.1 hypothetical protein D1007_10368 [Hordeum vulgare]